MDQILARKKHPVGVYALVTLVMAGLLAWVIASKPWQMHRKINLDDFLIGEVEHQPFEEFIYVSASAQPVHTFLIDALQGGLVDEIHIENGQTVKAGQALLKLTNTELEMDMLSHQLKITEQTNALNDLDRALDKEHLEQQEKQEKLRFEIERISVKKKKLERLAQSGFERLDELEQLEREYTHQQKLLAYTHEAYEKNQKNRQTKYDYIKGSRASLLENSALIEQHLQKLTICSPISGRITQLEIKNGQHLEKGAHIGQIDDESQQRLSIKINEFYLKKVRVGQAAYVMHQNQTEERLSIGKVHPAIEKGQFEAELLFDKPPADARMRGQAVPVKLLLCEAKPACVVKNAGFMRDTGGEWLFVLDEQENVFKKRPITIGRFNPNYVEIISGLSVGEKVLLSPYESIKNETTLKA